jgi:hypothetical protein
MRVALLALLVLTAAPVWGKWVSVGEGASTVYYVDPTQVRKEGDLRRIWALEVHKRPGVGGELSRKTQYEFDCKSGTSRTRLVSGYTGGMGGGEVLYNNRGTDKPHSVEPGSPEERLLKRACSQ